MEGRLEFLGFPITVVSGRAKTAAATLKDGVIRLTIPAELTKRQIASAVEALIWRVLAKAYQSSFQNRMSALNQRFFNLDPMPKLDIRRQYRRWGSYSTRHHIHLSHRLLLAPAELVDYVIIHEMAHAIELNHSRNFWRIVAQACPDYRERREQLMVFSATMPNRGKVPAKTIDDIQRQLAAMAKTTKPKVQDKLGLFANLPWKR